MTNESPFPAYLLVLGIIIVVLLLLLLMVWSRLRQLLGQAGAGGDRKPPHSHFVPGQISLVADHALGLSPSSIVASIRRSPIFRDDRLREAFIAPERVVTFNEGAQAFSLVFVDVPAIREERRLIQLVNDINTQLGYGDKPPQRPGDERRGPASIPNLRARSAAPPPDGEVALQVATPNWLFGGAPVPNGVGGPGGRPVPPEPSSIAAPDFWKFHMPAGMFAQQPDQLGTGVEVFILDTAPGDLDRANAYTKWGQAAPQQGQRTYPLNPSLDSLLGPGSPLDVTPAGLTNLLQHADFFMPDQDYAMSDHGLFVAGIIHTIAPQARLHLIEVLNPYGVGTFESIAHGFAIAAGKVTADAKILVNASLMMDVPQGDPVWLETLIQADPFWQTLTIPQLGLTVAPLQRICALFGQSSAIAAPSVGVVAAAGNDAKAGKTPLPPARYPAAFHGVLGVGALNHDNAAAAVYSNIADTPVAEGIAAFGGDLAGDSADPTFGIIGPYISPFFPKGGLNQSGWARWAGTSFATPVIVGTLAALMSEPSAPTLADAIQILRNAAPGGPSQTPVGEVFPVT
jgi:hypothetical protein